MSIEWIIGIMCFTATVVAILYVIIGNYCDKKRSFARFILFVYNVWAIKVQHEKDLYIEVDQAFNKDSMRTWNALVGKWWDLYADPDVSNSLRIFYNSTHFQDTMLIIDAKIALKDHIKI